MTPDNYAFAYWKPSILAEVASAISHNIAFTEQGSLSSTVPYESIYHEVCAHLPKGHRPTQGHIREYTDYVIRLHAVRPATVESVISAPTRRIHLFDEHRHIEGAGSRMPFATTVKSQSNLLTRSRQER
jgi:hypothetical protein